jgi:mRNA-degrading endonuclease RelE of RelBE toxin-antitoxin system
MSRELFDIEFSLHAYELSEAWRLFGIDEEEEAEGEEEEGEADSAYFYSDLDESTPAASESRPRISRSSSVEHEVAFSRSYALEGLRKTPKKEGPPPWTVGFSKQFRKDLAELDRKLQGRVLEALIDLAFAEFPFAPHGDTFKRLSGDLEGCWRYRFGDHRLVIRPEVGQSRLDALTLAARGSVYD